LTLPPTSEGPASRNAGFIRQSEMSHGPLPDKSGVPMVCQDAPVNHELGKVENRKQKAEGKKLAARRGGDRAS
jgi:hypothetical protein